MRNPNCLWLCIFGQPRRAPIRELLCWSMPSSLSNSLNVCMTSPSCCQGGIQQRNQLFTRLLCYKFVACASDSTSPSHAPVSVTIPAMPACYLACLHDHRLYCCRLSTSDYLEKFVLAIDADPWGSLSLFMAFYIVAVVLFFPTMILQVLSGVCALWCLHVFVDGRMAYEHNL